jgi:hypothetical protein
MAWVANEMQQKRVVKEMETKSLQNKRKRKTLEIINREHYMSVSSGQMHVQQES